MKNKAKAIFIVALLAVLSLGTVYFSKMGVDFRKQQLRELSDEVGRIDFSGQYAYMNIIPSSMKGKVGIVTFIWEKRDIDNVMIQLARVHEQFNAREDVHIVTNLVREFSDSTTYIDEIFERNGLTQDLAQWVVNAGDGEMLRSLAFEGYSVLPEQTAYPVHLLVDTEGVIRKTYNAFEPEEVRQLIRHITAILPRTGDADIKVKR